FLSAITSLLGKLL
uniref:Temporin-1SPb n=1 Tax=Lithobates septentrionalis TaxID=190274 RepID=TP1B_LITST|nr:RecName: Full=Temporin-1SPb [Lithobates septentrionalis]